jgi:hypothetical protein
VAVSVPVILDDMYVSLVGLPVGPSILVSDSVSVPVARDTSGEVEVVSVLGSSRVLSVVGDAGVSLTLEAEAEDSEVVDVRSTSVDSGVVVGEGGASSAEVVVSAATAAAIADRGSMVAGAGLVAVREGADAEASIAVLCIWIPPLEVSSSSPNPSSRFTRFCCNCSVPGSRFSACTPSSRFGNSAPRALTADAAAIVMDRASSATSPPSSSCLRYDLDLRLDFEGEGCGDPVLRAGKGAILSWEESILAARPKRFKLGNVEWIDLSGMDRGSRKGNNDRL